MEAARTCILILGMHRSGTSALTRVLGLLGATLPRDLNNELIGAIADHWEPLPLVQCHDAMLDAAGSRWSDWRAFNPNDIETTALMRFKQEISGLLVTQFGHSPLFVLKDPRVSRFVPLYRELLEEKRIKPRHIVALRNPLAVMMSLRVRDGMTQDFAGLLWLRHMLDAERASRGEPRMIVSYERVMAGWRPVVADLAAGLGIDWPTPPEAVAVEIDAFLTPAKQHHSFVETALDARPDISAWIKDAYRSMRTLEHDAGDASARATLDRIGAEFNAGASAFGAACFPELAVQERRATESVAERDLARAELQAAQTASRDVTAELEAARAELQAAQTASRDVMAELEAIRRSWWWPFAARMQQLGRRPRSPRDR